MSETPETPKIGSIISADITVANADAVRDFYQAVMGWSTENMPMSDDAGNYNDYVMKDAQGNWTAGVCHKRGQNADLPPQWIVYVKVADVGQSVAMCGELGGKVLKEMKGEDGSHQLRTA